MKKQVKLLVILVLSALTWGCNHKSDENPINGYSIEVILKNSTFTTNQFLRIPYTLKTWEWKKNGLKLMQIRILDDVNKTVLQTLHDTLIPRIFMDPLPSTPIFHFDKIYNYYFSIQLPIPVGQVPPVRISQELVFRDTVNNTDITVAGGAYTPDYGQVPLVIPSPIRGTRWLVCNQSTNDYHFYTLVFMGGKMGNGERFAFDAMQMDVTNCKFCDGDPGVNSTYFCYGDTLYAIADGIIATCSDTMKENDGNLKNHHFFQAPLDYAGNHVILKMDNGYYAMYAHLVKHSLLVSAGDTVVEGQPIGLLGNSGNSDAPHLHFEIGDSPDFFMANSIPIVFRKFTKIGNYGDPTAITPVDYFNTMNEQKLILTLE